MRSDTTASKRYQGIRIGLRDEDLELADIVAAGDHTIEYSMAFLLPKEADGKIDVDDERYEADLVVLETEPADRPDKSAIFTAMTIRTTGHDIPPGLKHGTYRLLVDSAAFVDALPPEMFDDSVTLVPIDEDGDEIEDEDADEREDERDELHADHDDDDDDAEEDDDSDEDEYEDEDEPDDADESDFDDDE